MHQRGGASPCYNKIGVVMSEGPAMDLLKFLGYPGYNLIMCTSAGEGVVKRQCALMYTFSMYVF